MRRHIRASALVIAFLGTVGFAAAQSVPMPDDSSATGAGLTQAQKQSIADVVKREPPQAMPPGYQPQVGMQLPGSVKTKALPPEVVAQIPQLRTFEFAVTPGYLIVVDPNTTVIMQMVALAPDANGTDRGSAGPRGPASTPMR